ncbi:MAG: LysM peptidoglycan-binding domain-containing protein [Patescibacteria group bacterium]|nr:LysM peptidoglycan-binding domain-containing protein [Patescibacteria group bacterium]
MPNNFRKKFELSPRLKLGVGRGRSQNQILKFSAVLFLILAAGLTINAVRLMVSGNSKTSAISAPQVLGASDVKQDSGNGQVSFVEYTVIKGDTLFNVSQKFNINWATLATLNSLKSPYTLKPGQILKIPR